MKIQKLFESVSLRLLAEGKKVEGGSNLELITRPSNEMVNHWLYSAASSRSSPTAQPAATTIIDNV